MQTFRALGAPSPDLQNSPSSLQFSGYAPDLNSMKIRVVCQSGVFGCGFALKLRKCRDFFGLDIRILPHIFLYSDAMEA